MDEIKLRIVKYLDSILEYAENTPDTVEKARELAKMMEEYHKYCYEKGIDCYNDYYYEKNIGRIANMSFVVDSKPDIHDMDEDMVKNAWNHLKRAKDNNSGISEEEARLLLDWVVQKAWYAMSLQNGGIDIENSSMDGMCGYSQLLTLAAFERAGIKVTINSARYFSEYNYPPHAFGTVTLPIEKDGEITNKQYLIDATYRQFFSTSECHKGMYYRVNKIETSGPRAGYYMINYLNGEKIAQKILKNGYIELTPEVLLKYACAFKAQNFNINTKGNIDNVIKETTIEDLERILEEKQEYFDADEEEIDEVMEIVHFPESSYKI